MAETTVSKVRAIASHLSNLPDSTIQMYIDDAKVEMQQMSFKPEFEEKIQRYLAAHYGTIQNPRAKSESVDGLGSQSYSDTTAGKEGLKSTEYGQEVLRLIKKSGKSVLIIS